MTNMSSESDSKGKGSAEVSLIVSCQAMLRQLRRLQGKARTSGSRPGGSVHEVLVGVVAINEH